jgi:hypothetical protein
MPNTTDRKPVGRGSPVDWCNWEPFFGDGGQATLTRPLGGHSSNAPTSRLITTPGHPETVGT